ncbi:MAG: hypothetical protein ACOC33_00100 [bacterium]
MAINFNKYRNYKNDNTVNLLPFIEIQERPRDKIIEYKQGITRFDKISNEYYGDPSYSWVILNANPEYLFEWDIPDGTLIRIPFPIEQVLDDYINKVDKKFNE